MNQDDPELGSEQGDLVRSDFSSEEGDYELNDLRLDLISETEISDPTRATVLSGLVLPSVREILKTFESRGSSAPTSPVKQKRPSVTLSTRSGSCSSFFNMALSQEVQTALAPLKKTRRGYKSWVTRSINNVVAEDGAGTLTCGAFTIKYDAIKNAMNKVVNVQDQISQVFDNNGVSESQADRVADEQETAEFLNSASNDIGAILTKYSKPIGDGGGALHGDELVEALKQIGSNNLTVKVETRKFYGNANDRLKFKDWLSEFYSVINLNPLWDENRKLTFLRQQILGDAATFIAHLDTGVGNYDRAIQALKDEYLNEEYNVDELFRQLLQESPERDVTYQKTAIYLASVRNKLHTLKNHYDTDLIDPSSSGHKLLSHIVFNKLSSELRRDFKARTQKDYPTFKEIMEKQASVIHNIVSTRSRTKNFNDNYGKHKGSKPSKDGAPQLNYGTNVQNVNAQASAGGHLAFQNKPLTSDPLHKLPSDQKKKKPPHCRFCIADGHTDASCHNYVSRDQRLARCKELSLCQLCASATHKEDSCLGKQNKLFYYCKVCGSRGHAKSLCPDPRAPENNYVCLNTGSKQLTNYLLPVISIRMRSGSGSSVRFNALFDTCSSRSYIDASVASRLGINREEVPKIEYEVKTFLGGGAKSLGVVTLIISLPSGREIATPVFIDYSFDVKHEVRGLATVVKNLKAEGVNLVAEFTEHSNVVPIQGIIGQDILDFIEFRKVPCMNGSALELANGLMPSGNTEHFLFPGQVGDIQNSGRVEVNFETFLNSFNVNDLVVNNSLEPEANYPDPCGTLFFESNVERGLELMAGFEVLSEVPSDISNYDKEKILEFENGIEIKDKVYIELVWHNNIKDVPSNWQHALKICAKVYDRLLSRGQLEMYNSAISELVESGVVSDISQECSPENYDQRIWIPHRGIIKDDVQSTYKMRPIFNCSFKSRKDRPSLNEAAYQGVNLMQNMLDLILLFRTNKYVFLGDLKKAFLQIMLKSLEDKNRFCFFWRIDDKIRCYRFNTIIFGFTSSPFILNYVIKHVTQSFPADECSSMIRSNFFVDNLVKTSNDIERLTWLYQESVSRLDGVGFELRSCNTNNMTLKQLMLDDGRFITHGCKLDKVLGYRYSAESDTMCLAPVNLDCTANTKRQILSESSKLYDPLSLAAPVLATPKLLVSRLWAKGVTRDHWDEVVDEDERKKWSSMSKELELLSSIKFSRPSLSDEGFSDFFLFADASKSAYGFVVYAVQDGRSNLIFAKTKVAPLRPTRSLPQLELLGALTALKGAKSLLLTFSNFVIRNIYLCLDAQVVIAWLTSSNNVRSVYSANRIKDSKLIMQDIFDSCQLRVQIRYVPTDQNPGDLLTRGLSVEKFKENMDFWCHGPIWIRNSTIDWPVSELRCLSLNSRNIVLNTEIGDGQEPVSPLIPFEKYSWLHKLVGAVAKTLEFVHKLGALKGTTMLEKWGTTDYHQSALLHLIQSMQASCFPEEIQYLKGTNGRIPNRVKDFNLFLDSIGILRCGGRLGKASYFPQEALRPILLEDKHPLSILLIRDFHRKVKHLGVQTTLNKMRMSGFRVTKPFRTVKSIVESCIICRRVNALAYKYPKMNDIPKHRVQLVKPFLHVGVDYTSHIWCTEEPHDIKYYIIIFTCLNTRAIYVDLLPDMSTNQFLLVFVRFVNEHGIPTHVYSDNARSFVNGVYVIKEVFSSDEFKEKFSVHSIKHIRIPVYSPWQGATWERMIRTMKACLYKCIGKRRLEYFRLKTILSDIVNAVNSRPLTYRNSTDQSLEILTPNHFIRPYAVTSLLIRNPKDLFEKSASRRQLVHSLEVRNEMLETFKKSWFEEYLLSLQETYKCLHDTEFSNKIRVGEIVLIRQPNLKRHQWILGRVLELYYGNDKKVRSAKVLRSGDWEKGPLVSSVYSIKHLYPMELSISDEPSIDIPEFEGYFPSEPENEAGETLSEIPISDETFALDNVTDDGNSHNQNGGENRDFDVLEDDGDDCKLLPSVDLRDNYRYQRPANKRQIHPPKKPLDENFIFD